jgi:hypothetical protein
MIELNFNYVDTTESDDHAAEGLVPPTIAEPDSGDPEPEWPTSRPQRKRPYAESLFYDCTARRSNPRLVPVSILQISREFGGVLSYISCKSHGWGTHDF